MTVNVKQPLPLWFTNPPKYSARWVLDNKTEPGVTLIRYPSGGRPVKWRSDCDYCTGTMPMGESDFWPSHDPGAGDLCQSGRQPHCTCDSCF